MNYGNRKDRQTRRRQPGKGRKGIWWMLIYDPVNNKYPIDSPEHVRAAWSYINHKDNAGKYDADEVKTIKERIKRAAKSTTSR